MTFTCPLCGGNANKAFEAEVLGKNMAAYCTCPSCGLLFAHEPTWLAQAYNNPIAEFDTGILVRNLYNAARVTFIISLFFDRNSRFLDYAGGYGIFVRLMRDIGFDFYWDDRYTLNLFAKGFKYTENQIIDAITTFESFEHFVNPIQEIEYLLKISENIIFSTELLPNKIPEAQDWWYYGLEHG